MNLSQNKILSYIIGMIICIILSAFFSATETAFSSYNKNRLKAMKGENNKKVRLILSLSAKYDQLISTILIGNNIVNIAVASIGTVLFVNAYGDIGATLSTIVITIVVLIFGEVSPKSIAKDFPEKFCLFAAPFIQFLIWILLPLNYLFMLWKKFLSFFLKPKEDNKISQAELLMFVDEVQEEGSIDKNEGNLLRNAIEFTDLTAEEILTHRVDLEALPITATKEETAQLFYSSKFSRLLIYKYDIDNIVGILNIKDFYTKDGLSDKSLEELITPPLFIHRWEKISNLLKKLQNAKSHIAVVLDEYGGTLGIVTMEDILEELVGEIWDEHDDITEFFKKIGENKYIVNCEVTFDEFCKFFEISESEKIINLNGWITEKLEKMPVRGDSFISDNLKVTVTDVNSHRIKFITVEKLPKNIDTESD